MPHLTWLEAEQEPNFPPTESALQEPNGLLAVGGELSPLWLLRAYQLGIFPWFNEGEPIMWWSPAPRMILEPGQAHISRSLKKQYRKSRLKVTVNQCFDKVIKLCSTNVLRQEGTWITPDMIEAYRNLHYFGWAHSFEVWDEDLLIGGLYGIGIDHTFFGESMFSLQSGASKFAFIALSQWGAHKKLTMIDCQLHNPYLESMGAFMINRREFQSKLPKAQIKLPSLDSFEVNEYFHQHFVQAAK